MLGKRIINTGTVACTTDTNQILDGGTTQSTALYRFEDNANDTSNSTGKFGKGAAFNGTSSYIDLPSGLANVIRTAAAFSVSFWFKRNGNQINSYGGRLVHILDDIYININLETNNTVKALVVQPGSVYPETVTGVIPDGVWQHIVFAGDSNGIKLYLNGILADSDNWNGTFITYTNSNYKFNMLGYSGSGVAYLKAEMDQVRIFNRAVSANEVITLYNETTTTANTLQVLGDTSCVAAYTFEGNADGVLTTTDLSTVNFPAGAGCIALYEMNGNATDTSNTYSTLATDVTYNTGAFGKAAIFNGSSSKIDLNSSIASVFTDNFTFSAWVYPTDNSNYNCIFSNGYGMELYFYQGAFELYSNNTNSGTGRNVQNFSTSTTNYAINQWHHVALTFTKTSQSWYINGQAEGTNTTSSYTPYDGNNPTLGYFSPSSLYYFSGRLDQVRIFNTSLSASNVATLARGAGSAYNGTASNVIYDYSPSSPPSNITYTTGKFGKAAVFNGSNSLVTVSSSLPWANSFSISMWLKPSSGLSASNYYIPFYQKGYDSSIGGTGLAFYTYGYVLQPWVGSIGGSYYNIFNTGTLTANQWNHVVLTRNYGVAWELFLNGSSLGTYTAQGLTNDFSDTEYYFGGFFGGSYSYNGEIDQVRIFDKALSLGEINSVYNETTTTAALGTISNPSTVAYYKMQDATDETGSYNGTASNVDFNVQGKYGFAGLFNGSSSVISASNPNSLGGARSFSAWIKTTSTDFQGIITNGGGSHASGLNMFVYNNKLYSTSGKGNGENYGPTSSANVNTGDWVHCVLTMSGTAIGSTLKTYVNGSLDGTHTTTVLITDTYAAFRIGGRYINSSNAAYFNGAIDQVRIFDKEISASEVTTLYNEVQCANTIATPESYFNTKLYTGDGGTQDITGVGFAPGMTWIKARSVGYSHSLQDTLRGPGTATSIYPDLNSPAGTYGAYGQISAFGTDGFTVASGGHGSYPVAQVNQNGVTYASWNWKAGGILNQSASFNGSNSYISTGYTAPTGTAASISLWVNIASYTNYGGFAIDSTGGGAQVRFTLGQGSAAGKLWVSVGDGSTSWYDETTLSLTSYGLNKWFHLVGTVDGTSVKIYINGSLIHTFTSSVTYVGGGQHQYYLGGWGNSLHFNGKMDQVRFFNRAILDSEVTTLYNETSSTINTLQVLGDNSCVAAFPLGANANDLNTNNTSSSAANVTFNNPGHLTRNTSGTLESTVSASPESGFSIVKYTGTGSATTVGHGLNKKPNLIIFKGLGSTGTTDAWPVYASPTTADFSLYLYENYAAINDAANFNDTEPTSSVFTVGTWNGINKSSVDYVAYCFANIDGYQRIGSYVGNGSANGPFIYTGFEPAWIMIKNASDTGSWIIHDNKRDTANPRTIHLRANLPAIEDTGANEYVNFYNNGFQLIGTGQNINHSHGDTYLYLAIAANPDTTAPTKASSFNTVLYNGGASSVTQVGFKPDLLWVKGRTFPSNNRLFDSVRGASAGSLRSNGPQLQETASGQRITSFDSDGFTAPIENGDVNQSSQDFVAWNWKALDHDRNLAAINNDGSITSIVSANPAAGFSIVKYTGNSLASMSVGHGLSQSPQIVISKRLDSSQDWGVYTNLSTGNNTTDWLSLNDADAYGPGNFMNLSSTLLSAVATGAFWIQGNQIAYCWHSVAGYSKIGTYTGDGTTSGKIITTGFEPSFLLTKPTGPSGGYWYILDNKRSTTNPRNDAVFPNDYIIEAESSNYNVDFLSNGFELKNNAIGYNTNNENYIYIAFA